MPRINLMLGAADAGLAALLNLYATRDLEEFWRMTRRLTGLTLVFDSCWLELPLVASPNLGSFIHGRRFTDEKEFRRFCTEHPARKILRSRPYRPTLRLSDFLTENELKRTRFYREFMAASGEAYAVVMALGRGKDECFMGIHRQEKTGDFSSADMRFLRELQHHLATALKRLHVQAKANQEKQFLATLFAQMPVATAILNWELVPLHCTTAALELGAIWAAADESARFLKRPRHFDLPPDIAECCHLIKSRWINIHGLGRASEPCGSERVQHSILDMSATVCLMPLNGTVFCGPVFVVDIVRSQRGIRSNNARRSTSLLEMRDLTPKEREVALLICDGHSDKEIATGLGKSLATVKKQLGAIYRKFEVPSRSKLAALLRR